MAASEATRDSGDWTTLFLIHKELPKAAPLTHTWGPLAERATRRATRWRP